jgi:hypothetical protein
LPTARHRLGVKRFAQRGHGVPAMKIFAELTTFLREAKRPRRKA